jgi:hypothetical protein
MGIYSHCNKQQTLHLRIKIQDKSAASFCCQVAPWVLDIFCNFYFVKNHKIANYSTATKDRKNKHRFGIFRIKKELHSLQLITNIVFANKASLLIMKKQLFKISISMKMAAIQEMLFTSGSDH